MPITDFLVLLGTVAWASAWFFVRLPVRSPVLWLAPTTVLLAAIFGSVTLRWQYLPPAILAAGFLIVLLILRHARRNGAQTPQNSPWRTGAIWAVLAVMSLLPMLLMPVFSFDPPEGKYEVGFRSFELTDIYRRGELEAADHEPRRFRVYVWYPSDNTQGAARRHYIEGQEISDVSAGLAEVFGLPRFLMKHLALVETHSFKDAPIAALENEKSFPVLVFSHGFTSWPGQNWPLMEHLASKGYVVFAPYHAYDSIAVTFDDGTHIYPGQGMRRFFEEPLIREQVGATASKQQYGKTPEIRFQATQEFRQAFRGTRLSEGQSVSVWRRDLQWLAERIERGPLPESMTDIREALYIPHTGFLGMSFGGSSAAASCHLTASCRAAVNLDGTNYDPSMFRVNYRIPLMVIQHDWTAVGENALDAVTQQFPDENREDWGIDPNAAANDWSYEPWVGSRAATRC